MRGAAAVGGGAAGAAAVHGDGDVPAAEMREQLAGRLARRELDRDAVVRRVGKEHRDAGVAGALGVDDRGDAVDSHAVAGRPARSIDTVRPRPFSSISNVTSLAQRFLPRGQRPGAAAGPRAAAGVGRAGAEPGVERRGDRDLLLLGGGEAR